MKKNKFLTKLIVATLLLALTVTVNPIHAGTLPTTEWGLMINNAEIEIPAEHGGLRNSNGRLYAPLRFVTETLGAKVTWQKEIPEQVIIEKGDIYLNYSTKRNTILDKEGKVLVTMTGTDNIAVKPILDPKLSRMFLPIRFVVEPLGYQVTPKHRLDIKLPTLKKERYAVITGGDGTAPKESITSFKAYEKELIKRRLISEDDVITDYIMHHMEEKNGYKGPRVGGMYGASGPTDYSSVDLKVVGDLGGIEDGRPNIEYRIRGWLTPGVQGMVHDYLVLSAKTEADGEFIWEQWNKYAKELSAVGDGKEGTAPDGTHFLMDEGNDCSFIRIYIQ